MACLASRVRAPVRLSASIASGDRRPDVGGGLSSSIDIIRDADAIPHIFASNVPDALFGLGYVHAQDRLWQMEFQRRIGHGRLSEIFGAAAVPQDRFLRTVGFGRAARVGLGADARRGEGAGQRVRGGRECVHLDASRLETSARIHAAPLRARALVRRRRRRLGEDDGVGPQRELLVRAAAGRPRSRGRRGADAPADAAVSGRWAEHRFRKPLPRRPRRRTEATAHSTEQTFRALVDRRPAPPCPPWWSFPRVRSDERLCRAASPPSATFSSAAP